jgi:diguanylate cyclase (GGDEF)-like protein
MTWADSLKIPADLVPGIRTAERRAIDGAGGGAGVGEPARFLGETRLQRICVDSAADEAATLYAKVGFARGYVVALRDARPLQQPIDKLVNQTTHDEHTRLLRRAELVKRLWRVLQESGNHEPQALIYLDLDHFKSINDTAGHAAGDLAIRQIASRLKCVVRDRDTLARLGGDEFGLLLERCPAELARQRAMQLHQAVESYVLRWNGETYRLAISIGLALFSTRNHSLNTILASADSACYQAKRNGGNGPHIHEVRLD